MNVSRPGDYDPARDKDTGRITLDQLPEDIPQPPAHVMTEAKEDQQPPGVMVAGGSDAALRQAAEQARAQSAGTTPKTTRLAPSAATQHARDWLTRYCKQLAREMREEGYYVKNPYSGGSDWHRVTHWVYMGASTVYDKVRPVLGPGDYKGEKAGTEPKGITCKDYANLQKDRLLTALGRAFRDAGKYPQAPDHRPARPGEWKLEVIRFAENPPTPPPGFKGDVKEFYNQLMMDDHVLFRLTYPDGQRDAIDFWHNARHQGPARVRWSDHESYYRKKFGKSMLIQQQRLKDFGIREGKYGKYDIPEFEINDPED
jgi:hypothetical protein